MGKQFQHILKTWENIKKGYNLHSKRCEMQLGSAQEGQRNISVSILVKSTVLIGQTPHLKNTVFSSIKIFVSIHGKTWIHEPPIHHSPNGLLISNCIICWSRSSFMLGKPIDCLTTIHLIPQKANRMATNQFSCHPVTSRYIPVISPKYPIE